MEKRSDAAFDRLLIIGEHQTSGCFAIINTNSQDSSENFRNVEITVGSKVRIHEAMLAWFFRLGKDKATLILKSEVNLNGVS